ncbi:MULTISPECIES: hypothetical protein [unclassified Pseudomonas]|uniref:hypothetical protein n=1 Tax=unclassified Pseudomonas TaxID=196821 RepID=UPI00215CA56B|nr:MULTISPECIES: hypothetical protein [unclassified Pseudomonas]MCR8932834.1 hypothetical protein [Pseudomonas sp. S11A4]MCR8976437.1 hypothetical protein [Pseudomonas sp. S11P7]
MNEQDRKFRVYGAVSVSTSGRAHNSGRRAKITAPPIISIYDFSAQRSDAFKRTMQFLTDIKKYYRSKNCFVDFSDTVTVTAAAIVVVYAAIEQAGIGRKGKAEIIWSKSDRVNRQLRLSNLSRLIRGHKISYALDSVSHMPIVSSVGGEMSDNVVDFIQNRIYTDMSAKIEHRYGDAVSETINNVGSHAYPLSNDDEKKWWLICHTMGKKLYLAIYDTGVGIPKTVIERRWFMEAFKFTYPQAFKEMLAENPGKEAHLLTRIIPARISDHELIGMSMKGDVSGTKKKNVAKVARVF